MPSGDFMPRTAATHVEIMIAPERNSVQPSVRVRFQHQRRLHRLPDFLHALHRRPKPRRRRVHAFHLFARNPLREFEFLLAQQIAPDRVRSRGDFFQIAGRARRRPPRPA